jgi:hypothetical protein
MRSLSLFLLMFCLSAAAWSQEASTGSVAVVPTLVNYSGTVRDLNGQPLTGVVGVTFALYKESQGGSALWLEAQNVQPDKTGHYSVTLGSTTSEGLPSDLFAAGEARWLGIRIEGQEEQPRVLLLSVPYALKAADAQTLGGLPPSAFALAPVNSLASGTGAATVAKTNSPVSSASPLTSSDVTTTGGTVRTLPLFTTATNIQNSIVTQNGTSAIDVHGQLNVGEKPPTTGILNSAPNSALHVGFATTGWSAPANSTANGTDAIHATGGSANDGVLASTSGGNGAVLTGGVGLTGGAGAVITGGAGGNFGLDAGAGGPGLIVNGGETLGDFGGGDGIDAYGGAGGANGVVGIAGQAFDQGSMAGVIGTGGSSAQGQYGPVPNGPGLVGNGGSGSSGDNTGGDGIDALAGIGCSGCPNGLAGSFTGDVTVSGDLKVSGTKSFRIDHPLDPANKYLYHAALESSEVLDLYSGNVTLDVAGEATVQLPDWFQTLNGDFRYQLTAIGAAAPNLHIAQEIENNNFRIAGGASGMKVSWQVTGRRQDAWEKAHPMQVEVAKSPTERGYYINPELFGAPPQKNLNWARMPELMKRLNAIEREQAARTAALLAKRNKTAGQ